MVCPNYIVCVVFLRLFDTPIQCRSVKNTRQKHEQRKKKNHQKPPKKTAREDTNSKLLSTIPSDRSQGTEAKFMHSDSRNILHHTASNHDHPHRESNPIVGTLIGTDTQCAPKSTKTHTASAAVFRTHRGKFRRGIDGLEQFCSTLDPHPPPPHSTGIYQLRRM